MKVVGRDLDLEPSRFSVEQLYSVNGPYHFDVPGWKMENQVKPGLNLDLNQASSNRKVLFKLD